MYESLMLEKALKDIAYMLQKINENLSAIKEEIKKGRGSSESVEGFSLKGKEKPVIINGQKLGEHEIYCGETKFVYNRDDIQKALEEAIYKIEGFRKYLPNSVTIPKSMAIEIIKSVFGEKDGN